MLSGIGDCPHLETIAGDDAAPARSAATDGKPLHGRRGAAPDRPARHRQEPAGPLRGQPRQPDAEGLLAARRRHLRHPAGADEARPSPRGVARRRHRPLHQQRRGPRHLQALEPRPRSAGPVHLRPAVRLPGIRARLLRDREPHIVHVGDPQGPHAQRRRHGPAAQHGSPRHAAHQLPLLQRDTRSRARARTIPTPGPGRRRPSSSAASSARATGTADGRYRAKENPSDDRGGARRRRQHQRLDSARGLGASRLRHLPDGAGPRPRGGARQPIPGPRRRRPPRRGRLGLPAHPRLLHRRQHLHGEREGRRRLHEDRQNGRPDDPWYPRDLRRRRPRRRGSAAGTRYPSRSARSRRRRTPIRERAGHRAEWRTDVTGLALSGGGVRSATVALGLLQALARHGRLRCVDFLSTVSGGGYTGAFLGRWFARYCGDLVVGRTRRAQAVDAGPDRARADRSRRRRPSTGSDDRATTSRRPATATRVSTGRVPARPGERALRRRLLRLPAVRTRSTCSATACSAPGPRCSRFVGDRTRRTCRSGTSSRPRSASSTVPGSSSSSCSCW